MLYAQDSSEFPHYFLFCMRDNIALVLVGSTFEKGQFAMRVQGDWQAYLSH